jgi:hypothetical protein
MPDQSMINRDGEGRREGVGRVQHRAGEETIVGKGGIMNGLGNHQGRKSCSGASLHESKSAILIISIGAVRVEISGAILHL